MWRKGNSLYIVDGNVKWYDLQENNVEVSQEIKVRTTI